jgi:hypothetical protein
MSGLSNIELKQLAKSHGIPLDAVVNKDQLKRLNSVPIVKKDDLIINLSSLFDKEGNMLPGSHWVSLCYFKKANVFCYYDSYGFVPPVDVVQFCDKTSPKADIIYTDTQIQALETTTCGYYAIIFIYYMRRYVNKQETNVRAVYNKFVKEFSEKKLELNNTRLGGLLKKYF